MNLAKLFLIAALACIFLGVASADDEDVPLPPEVRQDNAPFRRGHGAAPANGDSLFHRDIRMLQPGSNGEGCPAGTMQAVLSPDAKTLSLLFDNFSVIAGGSGGQRRVMKICMISIPFKVPPGMQVSVVQLDYRGFNSIPARARTRYVTAYFFTNAANNKAISPAVRRTIDFQGPLQGDYTVSSDIAGPGSAWSGCGKDVN